MSERGLNPRGAARSTESAAVVIPPWRCTSDLLDSEGGSGASAGASENCPDVLCPSLSAAWVTPPKMPTSGPTKIEGTEVVPGAVEGAPGE